MKGLFNLNKSLLKTAFKNEFHVAYTTRN